MVRKYPYRGPKWSAKLNARGKKESDKNGMVVRKGETGYKCLDDVFM